MNESTMKKILGTVVTLFIGVLVGALAYDIWLADEVADTDVACPTEPSGRYSEDELHRAYEMTRGMSRDDAAPMWHDEQLERSLTDPVFVAELEAHFCRMQQMVGER